MRKLGKRLKREVFKSPAKTCVLGLVTLVAIWYWAPLVTSWLSGGSTEAAEDLVVDPAAPEDLVVTPAASRPPAMPPVSNEGEKRPTSCNWQTLVAWRGQDSATEPATLPDGLRDPFQRKKTPNAEALISQALDDDEKELEASNSLPAAIAGAPIDLAQLQLVLGGTIVGKRVRSATINGNIYREGGAIPVTVDGGGQNTGEESGETIGLTLREVHPRHVVIEWQGQQRRLEIERAKLASGDRIARSGDLDGTSANVNGEN
jgi:hypothetical protein